jgi:cyanuric acid amidohydrolase
MQGIDVEVFRYGMESPDDVSGMAELIESGKLKVNELKAIIAQTEGDVYARGYATLKYQDLLSGPMGISKEEVFKQVPMLMIGLTAGLMSPHSVAFTTKKVEIESPGEKRLAVGVVTTRDLKPEEYGLETEVDLVVEAVQQAMKDAFIESVADVHCVSIKLPAMTAARVADAQNRGQTLYTTNPLEASNRAKGACALGVAVALGEVDRKKVTNEAINRDFDLYSSVATTSAGNEQTGCRVVVMGNSTRSVSKHYIASGVMKDSLDLPSAKATIKAAGLKINDQLNDIEKKKLTAVFINAGANALPHTRGRRHTMMSDFLSGYAGIIAKAVANSVVGALVGDAMVLASAGWEHQGPRGSSLIAVIAEK